MTQSNDLTQMFFELKKLTEKETKVDAHCIYLSDYWRKSMIPRGLRMDKFPSFESENPTFKTQWEAILNKCSLDLMLLLIQEGKTQKTSIQNEIQELKQKIAEKHDPTQTALEQKLRDDIDKLSQTLKLEKLEKYRRDLEDYQGGIVYTWKKNRRRRTRSVTFDLQSSGDEAATSDYNDSADFLGTRMEQARTDPARTDQTRTNKRGGTRGGGGGGSGRFTQHNRYQLRPQHSSMKQPQGQKSQ